jgi:D-alanyl-D-alanine carboxypeptidase (penicillin-binding protein 5/6)
MHKKRVIFGAVSVAVVAVYSSYALLRPVAAIAMSTQQPTVSVQQSALSWPATGQAAIGAVDYGLLDHTKDDVAVPTASTAKLMTALMVLKAKPLALNETGPIIPITQAEVDAYARYVANGSSTVAVAAGENLTEYQALQAMLLPSANNIADLMAVWAYGSMEAYATAANAYAKELGMEHSVFGTVDASGLDPSSISTASDLVRLGIVAATDPVIAQIANQKTASIPVAGTISNVNVLLGTDDIIGLKTGNTDEAGGVFVFSANKKVGAKTVTVVGAIMAARTLYESLKAARPLLDSAAANFALVTAATANQSVGKAAGLDGSTTRLITQKTLSDVVWLPSLQQPTITLSPQVSSISAGQSVGSVKWTTPSGSLTTPVVAEHAISAPTALWRLVHPI